jgi:lipid-A-disaccharide synthase
MRIFICAGEPSGDLHGANLVTALRRTRPDIDCVGFGGDGMAAAGCRLLYPLCRLAVMGVAPVLANAPVFLQLLSRADRVFRHQRPDAVVLIDYPGFNWWLARRAHFHGVPVFYFVPPQLWAWAGWRVRKMRRFVDHVLCSLPFEEGWYRQRGVHARYIGHPYFDELAGQQHDPAFLAEQQARPGPVVALLPGSRGREVEDNLSTLLRAAGHVHAARPDARFLIACYKPSHRDHFAARLRRYPPLPVQVCCGRTAEIIRLARVAVAVSGSVGLELLYHGTPSVVLYHVSRLNLQLTRWLMKSPYISLVNLLAGKELFPEYLTDRCEAVEISWHVVRWLNDPAAHALVTTALSALRGRVAQPGACARAAAYVLEALDRPATQRQPAA